MVNTNELMLGNYLQFSFEDKISSTKGNKFCRIYQIESHSVRIEILKDSVFSILSDTDLEPILITEEILEKCGFKHSQESKYDYVFEENNEFMIVYKENNNWYFDTGIGGIKCNHLHTLQNVHFLLTGKQLKVNL